MMMIAEMSMLIAALIDLLIAVGTPSFQTVDSGHSAGEGEDGRRYSSRIELPQNVYKVDEIKAEMTNGVLKVRVPKVKEEERKDVFQVKIE
ncbi:hypothetical protein DCAR_0831693 [Daucus carota subsp. sativus]|uniref:Uncharacterized protein n=1 Tax=Daucus carota subsp. sativus TaxID=79200 RepID=A0A175YNV7_DAUCS|nr:hypothetical protein DCAR_0831693 [Daucus carota subsp. sativus]